jgi:hypothetical protein
MDLLVPSGPTPRAFSYNKRGIASEHVHQALHLSSRVTYKMVVLHKSNQGVAGPFVITPVSPDQAVPSSIAGIGVIVSMSRIQGLPLHAVVRPVHTSFPFIA